MAIKKVVDVIVNTAGAVKSTENLTKAVTNLDASFEDVYGDIQPLSGRMGELEDRMYELASAGQQNTQEFKDLQAQVGIYKKVIQDTDLAVDAMATTTSQKLGGALSGVAGGFSVAQGVMASFGADSQAVEEALLKVQSAMAISQGLDSVRESISSFKALGVAISGTAIGQKMLNVAQLAGAIGMRILNAVMNANPVFLLITGVAALAGAIAWLATEEENTAEESEKVNALYEQRLALLEELSKNIKRDNAQALKELQLNGASEKQLHEQRKKNLDSEEKLRKASSITERENIEQQRLKYKEALKSEDYELAKTIREKIDKSKASYKELQGQHKDYINNKKNEDKEYENKLAEDAKEEAEKQRARHQEAVAKQKERNQEKLNVERQLKDMELALIKDETEKQRATIEENYKRQIEDLKKNTLIGAQQRNQLSEAFEKERVFAIETINEDAKQKELDAEAEFKKQREDLEKEQLQQLKDGRIELLNSKLNDEQTEIKAVLDKYTKLIELAKKYGEDSSVFEDEQEKVIAGIKKKYRTAEEEAEAAARKKKAEDFSAQVGEMGASLQGLSDLGNLLTDIQLKNAEGNDAKQLAIQKKAFERNKKIQIAMATISGIQGVINALTATSAIPEPFGMILKGINAAIVGATTIANIAKIKATTFQGGGGGAATTSSGGGNVPNFNIVGAGGANQIAQGIAGQETPVVKTFVTAGDVTTQQSLDRNKVENATL